MSALRKPDPQLLARCTRVLGIVLGLAAGHVACAGPEQQAETQAAPIQAPESVNTPAGPVTTNADSVGRDIYNAVCIACHAAPGFGGAPALGDSGAWAARIAQGMDTLIDRAVQGYSGSTGIMPRKGGRVDLSDEEIVAAVEYMVQQVEL